MKDCIVIKLTKGYETVIDKCYGPTLAGLRWSASITNSGQVYAKRIAILPDKTHKSVSLHRCIIGAQKGELVDHINRNTLDNRRSNLRVATTVQNAVNSGRRNDNRSGYRGVCWQAGKWRAYIRPNGKQVHLGRFESIHDAALAYNNAALEIYGADVLLNKIP